MRKSAFFSRFVALLLVCLLLIPVGSGLAAAESVNLSSMTDDEIVDLYTRLTEELVSRGINKTAKLPQGTYIAGKDLPVGKYIFTCLARGDDWGNLTVKTEEGKGKMVLWEVVAAPEDGEEQETVFITLNKGDQLDCGVPFSLTIMTGAIFK